MLVLATDALRSAPSCAPSTRASRSAATQAPPNDVVIVGLDDKRSIEAGRTASTRSTARRHAAVIDALTKAGAKVIAYDVQFTEP